MAIPKFSVAHDRSIRLAQCDAVPQLMVIAGPNGCGKSTLLHALRRHGGTEKPIYVGPHRVSRRQTVQFRYLFTREISLQDLLTKEQLEQLEGVTLTQQIRSPWDYDDAVSFVKHGLAQIEVERGEAIKARYDREQRVEQGLPDVWEPLRHLTDHLLPHLRFHGVDTSNKNNVRCLWKVHRTDTAVDLDDLSSGEKSIIQLFYPLIESRVKKLVDAVRLTPVPEEHGLPQKPAFQQVVLIDEPELHLHPSLQVKVFDYLRALSLEGSQVIFTTQSTTLIEYATFEELYLLRPAELVPEGENQLLQLASDDERLTVLRNLFGTATNVVAMQPVIIVEGVHEKAAKAAISDRKVFRNLDHRFDLVTLIPGYSKSECLSMRSKLEECLQTFSQSLRVVALVDQDTTGEPQAYVHQLPVSMIENLLIDPEVFWEAMESIREKTGLDSVSAVEGAMNEILNILREYEVERRVLQALRYRRFQPRRPLSEIPTQASEFANEVVKSFASEVVNAEMANAEIAVKQLYEKNLRREHFDGKRILKDFFSQHLHSAGISREVFTYYAAKRAAKRNSVKRFFDEFFAKVLPSG